MIKKCLYSDRSENDIERSESSTGITNVTFKSLFLLTQHSLLEFNAGSVQVTVNDYQVRNSIKYDFCVCIHKYVVLSRNILWVER
jgi:hypothetical protein